MTTSTSMDELLACLPLPSNLRLRYLTIIKWNESRLKDSFIEIVKLKRLFSIVFPGRNHL